MRAAFATPVSKPGSLPLLLPFVAPRESCVTARSFSAAPRALCNSGCFRNSLACSPVVPAARGLALGYRNSRSGLVKRARAYQPSRWITASGSGRAAGARPWVARAANELRASGRTRQQNDYPAAGAPTPQEREIALMAASGMSNKQIGERLFLSHRTVGTHLRDQNPRWARTAGV